MFNAIKPKNHNHPSINAINTLGPRAMTVIHRYRSITGIAAYEVSLGPKVGRFTEVRSELRTLAITYAELASRSAAEIDGLDDVTRIWAANLQLNTSLDAQQLGIIEARSPEAILDNARTVVDVLQKHLELPLAAEALGEIEPKYESAKSAYDAAQEGRVAVQVKRHELQAIAESVHKELVKLRRVTRIALGSSHIDHKRLLIRNARATEAVDESPPETAESSSQSGGNPQPGPSG